MGRSQGQCAKSTIYPPQMSAVTSTFLMRDSLQGQEQGCPYRYRELPTPSFQDQLKPSSYRKSSLTTPAHLRPQNVQETDVLASNLQRTPSTLFCPDVKSPQFWLLGRWPRGQDQDLSFSSASDSQATSPFSASVQRSPASSRAAWAHETTLLLPQEEIEARWG